MIILPAMKRPVAQRKTPKSASASLNAGKLRIQFMSGNLGSIYLDGVEVLRGISYLVRDANWGTCPARITGLKTARGKGGTEVRYTSITETEGARLTMQALIHISPGEVSFHARATPDGDIRTNRTGFVVLHAINGVAGRPVTVTHTDGSVERARFPKVISPAQPFFDIRALEHSPAPGLKAHVRMEGQKFEMEDQRNWTDASYKTYVRSLFDPWPYVLKAGETFEQSVTLTLKGSSKRSGVKAAKQAAALVKVPEIGIAIGPDEVEASLRQVKLLKRLAPRHLTFTIGGLNGSGGELNSTCIAYGRLAEASGVPVTLEIVLPARAAASEEMAEMAAAVESAGLAPKRVVVTHIHDLKSFQPTDKRPWGPTYEEMAAAARQHFPQAEIGGGMISFFTELNRKRPPAGVFDFITHAICPIVHDASDEAVMQTLEALPHVFASGRSFIGKTPYHLGPSSIGARLNPYGASLASNPLSRRMCLAPNDPRQFTAFAVTWNKAVILSAAQAGLASVTLSALTGPRGLVTASGRASPLFDYLAAVMPFSGKRMSESAFARLGKG